MKIFSVWNITVLNIKMDFAQNAMQRQNLRQQYVHDINKIAADYFMGVYFNSKKKCTTNDCNHQNTKLQQNDLFRKIKQ